MQLKLLSLVLTLPLLLPQGVCLCGIASAESSASAEDSGREQEAAHPSCHHHRSDKSADPSSAPPARPHPGNPTDNQDDHAPGCPALKPAFVLRSAPDGTTAHSQAKLATATLLPDPDPLLHQAPAVDVLSQPSSARPCLYLRLRTLLI
jgi:hypothetical protein